MNRNIPNILTISRILIVPLFIILFFQKEFILQLLALIFFIIAAITDYFDGKLARKYKLESNLGKFLDPLADKLLVLAAYFCFIFVEEYRIPFWIILIILFREFSLTGLRMMAISQNRILHTSRLGKFKAATQMTTIIIILVLMLFKTFMIENNYVKITQYVKGKEAFWSYFFGNFMGNLVSYAPLILVIIATVVTLYSGIMYIAVNKDLLKDIKRG
ncbi:MAG: CDP-diacylglycerol--glycerol-3-phosphate 3-phosphatidyltransferase [Spirochaetes bacterium]|nr:CDP-diacylglycerol--glycerol-3-phosphate 3-phosphatidyltransferase [Spirochaetota bacterium]